MYARGVGHVAIDDRGDVAVEESAARGGRAPVCLGIPSCKQHLGVLVTSRRGMRRARNIAGDQPGEELLAPSVDLALSEGPDREIVDSSWQSVCNGGNAAEVRRACEQELPGGPVSIHAGLDREQQCRGALDLVKNGSAPVIRKISAGKSEIDRNRSGASAVTLWRTGGRPQAKWGIHMVADGESIGSIRRSALAAAARVDGLDRTGAADRRTSRRGARRSVRRPAPEAHQE